MTSRVDPGQEERRSQLNAGLTDRRSRFSLSPITSFSDYRQRISEMAQNLFVVAGAGFALHILWVLAVLLLALLLIGLVIGRGDGAGRHSFYRW